MDPDTQSRSAAPEAAPRTGWEQRPDPAQNPHLEDGSPLNAWREALERFNEIRTYAAYFLATKWDGVKLSFRNVALYAALGFLGLLAGGALIVTAVVLLCTGLAGGIGAMFNPDRPWAGSLILSLLLLALIAAGTIIGLKLVTNSSHKRTVQKYESRQRDQRINYGHDVRERAESQLDRDPAARSERAAR